MGEMTGRNSPRRVFRLEGLEERQLLSTAQVHWARPPAVLAQLVRHANVPGPYTPVTTSTGTLTGSVATDGLYGGTPVGYSSYSGQGNIKPFGTVVGGTTFLATSSTTNAAVLNVTNGALVLNTLRGGDKLNVYFTGSIVTNKHGQQSWTLVGTVGSGTGRFASATGTFSGVATANRSGMGTFTLKYTVSFDPAV